MAPPMELAAALARCNLPGQSVAAVPVAIFRSAWRALIHAGYRGVTITTFVSCESFLSCAGLRRGLADELDATGARLAGNGCVAAGRRNRLAGRYQRVRGMAAPLKSAQSKPGFVPLQSASALQDEGRVMRHCVADLVECCRKGGVSCFPCRLAVPRSRRHASRPSR